MNPKKLWLGMTLAPLLIAVLSGCPNTADGMSKDTKNAGEASAQAAEKLGEKTSQMASGASSDVKEMGKNVTAALEVTPRVKTALTADVDLNDAKNQIDVDSKDGIVHLKGHVTTSALKKKAGEIAAKEIKDAGGTDKVMNQLLVK